MGTEKKNQRIWGDILKNNKKNLVTKTLIHVCI